MFNDAKYTIPAREGMSMRPKADSDTSILYPNPSDEEEFEDPVAFSAATVESIPERPKSAPPQLKTTFHAAGAGSLVAVPGLAPELSPR